MRHSAEQERSKWFSVDRNPILSPAPLPPFLVLCLKAAGGKTASWPQGVPAAPAPKHPPPTHTHTAERDSSLPMVTQQRQNKAFLCHDLLCVVGDRATDRAPNSFCFTGQVLVKPALLQPAVLSPGCVWLLQRSLPHSQ